ncbi:MAG: hypothetical protein KAH04_07555, partial [Psychrilyobacter sp.]|nr:hypothetical protein [Psychrilyobacter sp.]
KLIMKIISPKGEDYKQIIGKDIGNSVYTFKFKTSEEDLIGNWTGRLYLGLVDSDTLLGTKNIKIETIVPPKIKVNNEISEKNKSLFVDVHSEYLFGAPAKDLKYKISLSGKVSKETFPNYRKFNFIDKFFGVIDTRDNKEGNLDIDGKISENFKINLKSAPYKIDFNIRSEVYQKDGRKLVKNDTYTYDLYNEYVGIEKINGYPKIGEILELETVAVTKDGEKINSNLEYRVYQYDSYWWWDFNSYDEYMSHYKSSDDTTVIDSGEVKSGENIKFEIPDWSDYYIEVTNPKTGQKAGVFVSGSYYSDTGKKNESFITIKTNKKTYDVGEKLEVNYESPSSGVALVSLESGTEILKSFKTPVKKGANNFDIEVTKKMFPGVYINVIVLQDIEKKENDRPLKIQGLQFVKITDKEKSLEIKVEAKDIYKDANEITVKVKSEPNTTFTIAAVDTGILSLTNYTSPNPSSYFYTKEKYQILNYDNYLNVLDYNFNKAYKTFKPGGGVSLSDAGKRKEDTLTKKPRFKLASSYKIGTTDENGDASVTFKFDDYMGEIRFMVVGVKDNRFGKIEKSSKVWDDVVILPGAPRFLAPKDSFVANFTAITNEKFLKKSILGIKVEGP